MQTHRFSCKKMDHNGNAIRYVFCLAEGDVCAGLLKTVFEEYIEHPILIRSRESRPFIAMGVCPFGLDYFRYEILASSDTHVEFKIISDIYLNQRVSEIDENADNGVYLKLPNGDKFHIVNANSRRLSALFYSYLLADILDGMEIDIDIDDYAERCSNCVFWMENLMMYLPIIHEDIEVSTTRSCVLEQEDFDLEKEEVECDLFTRDKYPDIAAIERDLASYSRVQ